MSLLATDWYVAKSGIYVDDDGNRSADFTSLVSALDFNNGKVNAGDTIWVEDGYVADDSSDPVMASNRYSCQVRLLSRRAITVRSKSGTYDEAKGLGVTVKGAPHSATQPLGTSAVRCLRTEGVGAVFIGFIFDGGCEANNNTYTGGGAFAQERAAFTNCLFRNCHATHGGGLGGCAGTTCYNCVFTNNFATGSGGGVVDASCEKCLIADNEAATGGGVSVTKGKTMTLRDCQILRNRAKSNTIASGGAVLDQGACEIIDCTVAGNVAQGGGGGICGLAATYVTNTWIVGNSAGHCAPTAAGNYGNGGGVCGAANQLVALVDCHVLSNRSISAQNNYASGGGAYYVDARKTDFIGNVVEGIGGGANRCVLSDCVVVDNVSTNDLSSKNPSSCGGICDSVATNCLIAGNGCCMSTGKGFAGGVRDSTLVGCVVSNNATVGAGGGIYWGTAVGSGYAANCVIVNNVSWDVGGGVYSEVGAELYNCLIARNSGASNVGAGGVCGVSEEGSPVPLLVNCTVTENEGNALGIHNSSVGGVRYVSLLNTIVWNNFGKIPDIIRGFASHSCGSFLPDEEGNIAEDPKLTADYRLKVRSPCRRTGLYDAGTMPWAKDVNDPRHLDLGMRKRLNDDDTIDMGCYGWAPTGGLLLLLR